MFCLLRVLLTYLVLAFGSRSMMADQTEGTEPWREKALTDLQKAKDAYEKSLKASNEKMISVFESQTKKVLETKKLKVDNQVKLVEQLRQERLAFEANNNRLPKSAPMLAEVQHYLMTMSVARKRCDKEFEDTAELFVKKKDLTTAKSILADKAKYFADVAHDTRLKWDHGIGSFARLMDGTWLETKRNGERYEFVETLRSTDYVEITHPTANYAIRIFDGHTEIRRGKGGYKLLFRGSWAN